MRALPEEGGRGQLRGREQSRCGVFGTPEAVREKRREHYNL